MTAPTIPPGVLVRRLEFILDSVEYRNGAGLDASVQLSELRIVVNQLKEALR